MSQEYSNPKRASDPHSLPDIEVFHHEHAKRELCALNAGHKSELYGECITDDEGDCLGTGWYWQSCLPGCLPDSEPMGPFDTYEQALADAREGIEDENEDGEEEGERFRCDQCEALMINGVFCHETGCPNINAKYIDGAWIKFYECRECGSEIREGESCNCMEPEPRDQAIRYLCDYGAWTKDELDAMDEEELAIKVLWIACGDIKESGDWYGLCH
jgi:hypothetical protein